MIFNKAYNTQAYLKAGLMGFAGSGKTYTASQIAIGLIALMKSRGVEEWNKPVMFLDTETGSDWVKPFFDDSCIELYTAKTRAFVDLVPAILEAEQSGSVLIIDSITHFWRELLESYTARKNRRSGLLFKDWAWLKSEWGKFTDAFINSNAHIIMCGRAGYEYDFFENESGKKELEKTGIKMKAETETGYEPSILILMEKHFDMETKTTYRTGSVLKDRSTLIDGSVFRNPTFEDLLPHINFLNLGGKQFGIDTSRSSTSIIPSDGKTDYQKRKEEAEIVLDEIQALLTKHYPSTKAEDKLNKLELLGKFFESRSWKRIETYDLKTLKEGYDKLHLQLEGIPAYIEAGKVETSDEDINM